MAPPAATDLIAKLVFFLFFNNVFGGMEWG